MCWPFRARSSAKTSAKNSTCPPSQLEHTNRADIFLYRGPYNILSGPVIAKIDHFDSVANQLDLIRIDGAVVSVTNGHGGQDPDRFHRVRMQIENMGIKNTEFRRLGSEIAEDASATLLVIPNPIFRILRLHSILYYFVRDFVSGTAAIGREMGGKH